MKQVEVGAGRVDKLDVGFAVVELDDVCLELLIDEKLDIGFSVEITAASVNSVFTIAAVLNATSVEPCLQKFP